MINTDIIITKQYPSAFFKTELEAILKDKGVDTVLLTGVTTSGCVRATCVDSISSDFVTIVVSDAVGDRPRRLLVNILVVRQPADAFVQRRRATGIGVDRVDDGDLVALSRFGGRLSDNSTFVDGSISDGLSNSLLIFGGQTLKTVVDVLDALDDARLLRAGREGDHGALRMVPRALLVLAVAQRRRPLPES